MREVCGALVVWEACTSMCLKLIWVCQVQLLPALAWVECWALSDLCMDLIRRLESTWTMPVPVHPSHRAAHLIESLFHVAMNDLLYLIITTEISRGDPILVLRLLCLTLLFCLIYSTATTRSNRSRIEATIDSSVSTMNALVSWSGSCRGRLGIFRAAAEAVDVALAEQDIFIGIMQLVNNNVHSIDSLLEGLKVCSYSNDVLI